jgi:amino acid adenylation domain-containing protein
VDKPRLLDRLSGWAARDPERPALLGPRGRLGYGELAEAVHRVSGLLSAHGVGPEDCVATELPRGGNAILAALGCWSSGAAYLPTDLRWPTNRRERVLADSATCVLMEATDGDPDVPGMSGEPGLRLRELTVVPRKGMSAAARDPGQLAYVIHTSGSTGTPNPVGITYGSLDNYADYVDDVVSASTDGHTARVLLSANLSFDASLRPIVCLGAGAALCVGPDLADGSWHEEVSYLLDNGVTVLSGVPSWYSGLFSAGFHVRDSRVRLAFVGGEALPGGIVRTLIDGQCAVVVQYGPTETTVAAAGGVVRSADFAEPPIGGAIAGARVHVLRADLTPVTPGTAGEVYVGGPGIGRGYLGNPRLTAARFVPDPWGAPGARMFRTGDRARAAADGGLGFLGRQDDQVKIGGLRIELGEISAVLNAHPDVTQSVAFVTRSGARPRLAACFVGRPDIGDSVRAHLAAELPEYEVPALLRQVDRLPVTGNGKVDVATLAAGFTEAAAPAAPEGDGAERVLVGIWQDVLGTPLSYDDDFFALGGGSLDALDILARVREEFAVRVRLRSFFQARTVRALHKLITEG